MVHLCLLHDLTIPCLQKHMFEYYLFDCKLLHMWHNYVGYQTAGFFFFFNNKCMFICLTSQGNLTLKVTRTSSVSKTMTSAT